MPPEPMAQRPGVVGCTRRAAAIAAVIALHLPVYFTVTRP